MRRASLITGMIVLVSSMTTNSSETFITPPIISCEEAVMRSRVKSNGMKYEKGHCMRDKRITRRVFTDFKGIHQSISLAFSHTIHHSKINLFWPPNILF